MLKIEHRKMLPSLEKSRRFINIMVFGPGSTCVAWLRTRPVKDNSTTSGRHPVMCSTYFNVTGRANLNSYINMERMVEPLVCLK